MLFHLEYWYSLRPLSAALIHKITNSISTENDFNADERMQRTKHTTYNNNNNNFPHKNKQTHKCQRISHGQHNIQSKIILN